MLNSRVARIACLERHGKRLYGHDISWRWPYVSVAKCSAYELSGMPPETQLIETPEIFTLFFVTLGPLKVIGPFAQRTRGVENATAKRIAWRAFAIATVAALVGGFLGRGMLEQWHVSGAALMLAAGIIFFLVALKQLLEQYAPPQAATVAPLPASPLAAAGQIVFPSVLTPYGIAALIALLANSQDTRRTAIIVGLLLLVMSSNLIVMLFARRILTGPVMLTLQVLGAVLGVLQVALSVEIILTAVRLLTTQPAAS